MKLTKSKRRQQNMRKIIGKKNKVHYVEETTRFQMVKSHKGWLVICASMFALGLGLTMPATTTYASQLDGQWTARTVQEIKADFDKSGTSQSYKIQWGDTLSAISAAINVSQDRLAQINSIENKDLIFAGNTIQIDGNGSDATITIKDQDGKADKVYNVDPNKPVVNTEKTNELQSENANDTGAAKATVAANGSAQATVAANESAQATVANGNTTVNDSSSVAGSSNNGASSGANGSTSTNVKPSNPTNPNGNNGSDNSNTNPSPKKTELEKLKETLASQNAKLSDLQSKSTAAHSDLDAAKSALTAAQNKDISQFESAVQAQTEKVNAIKTDLDNIKTEIDSNTKNIESLNEVIASLKANIASSDTNIVTAQNGLATAQSTNDAKQLAYNQIIATISDQYPSINVETADGLAALETSNPDLKASFDAAKSDKDDSELELENAKTAVSDATVAKPNMQASLTKNENKIAALTEQINTDTAKVSSLESKLTTETATLSDLQQQLDTAKNSNAEQLQADVNAKQSVVDNLTKEIESAKADIDKTTKAIADIELKVAREDATKSINSLKYLVASEKADFTNQLNATLTQDAINTIVTAAQAKDATNKAELDLKTSKTNAVSEINGLKFLSDKQSFTDKVNAAETIDAVASILSEAKAQDAAEQLTKSKVDAIADVNALSGLNASEKASFADKINASTALNGVASVVSDAKTVAKLNTYKESAKTTVSNLTKLSDESKAGYTTRIESATSAKDVDAIVAEAKAEIQLSQDKESAVSEIKALVNLSNKEQASFVKAVSNSTSKAAVDTVVSDAKAQDQKNLEAKQLEELRVNVKSEISAMDYLSDAQKQGFTSKVDAANTKTTVSNLLVEARATNELEKAKSEATTKINNLEHLSTKAKSDFTAKVANATTKDAVASIVSDAKVADALVGTKEDAKSTIDEFKFLSNTVKSELKTKVEAAKTEADVKSVVDYATQANEDAKQLQDVQAESIEAINAMTHLTQEQKDAFISKINESNLISEVKSIRANAVTENKLAEAKANAVSAINALTHLSDNEKTSFKDKVAATKADDAISSIVSEAKTRDTVIASQYTAVTRIMGLEYLSDSRKSEFVLQIQNATDESSIQQILDAAASEEPAAKELYDLKNVALNTVEGYTHISDDVKIAAATEIKNATSKDEVERLISDLQHKEEQAIKDELIAAKNNANSTIKAMKFLQASQKDKFIAQTSSAEDLAVLNSIVDAATAQDKIESQKGTVTFNIVGFDDQKVAVVERRIVEGPYTVTLKDLGLNDNIVFVSGDLTGTVKAQENKIVQINIVDTTKVQTLIIEARDVETGKIIKTVTTYSTEGAMFTPSYSQLELSADEWRVVNDIAHDVQTAKAGVVSKYTFDVKAFKPMLDKSQTIIAQQELVRLINQYRVSSRLTTLATDSKLDNASTIRAKEIEETFDHVRPNGSSFSSVLTQVGYTGYRAAGENIASFGGYGNVTGIQAADFLFNQWKNSPSHNANMLYASYTHVSFGVYADENSVYSSTVFTG